MLVKPQCYIEFQWRDRPIRVAEVLRKPIRDRAVAQPRNYLIGMKPWVSVSSALRERALVQDLLEENFGQHRGDGARQTDDDRAAVTIAQMDPRGLQQQIECALPNGIVVLVAIGGDEPNRHQELYEAEAENSALYRAVIRIQGCSESVFAG